MRFLRNLGVMALIKTISMILVMSLLLASVGRAEDAPTEGDEVVKPARAIYISLKPPFVVNYGGQGRLRYMKIEVSVRVSSSAGANSIRHHMPYIRNQLILLFSRQSEEVLDTQEGKELLRQQALEAVDTILMEEDGESDLVDLYFNQLVLQK